VYVGIQYIIVCHVARGLTGQNEPVKSTAWLGVPRVCGAVV